MHSKIKGWHAAEPSGSTCGNEDVEFVTTIQQKEYQPGFHFSFSIPIQALIPAP